MRAPHEHPADPLLVARIFAAALGRPVHFPVPATIVASNAAGVSVAGSKEENSKPAPAARKTFKAPPPSSEEWLESSKNTPPENESVLMWYRATENMPAWSVVDKWRNRQLRKPDFWARINPPNHE